MSTSQDMQKVLVAAESRSVVRQFLAYVGSSDIASALRLLAPDACLNAHTGQPAPLGGRLHGQSEIESFIRARDGLNIGSEIRWSINLMSGAHYVLYGLVSYFDASGATRRECTMATWFQVQRGLIERNDVYLDSAPFASVLGQLPGQEPAASTSLTDNLRGALSFSGELQATGLEEFGWLLDVLEKDTDSLRLPILPMLAEDCEWYGPSAILGGDSVRLKGRASIAACLQHFASRFKTLSRKVSISTQAEDTLLAGLELEVADPAGGEVLRLPLFAAMTVRGNVVVRVVEIYDSLLLLRLEQSS